MSKRKPKLGRHLYWRGAVIHAWYWKADPHARRGRRQVQRSTETDDPDLAARTLSGWEKDEADPASAARRNATLGEAYDLLIANRKALIAQGERSGDSMDFYKFSFRCVFLYAGRLIERVPASLPDANLTDEDRDRLVEKGKLASLSDVGSNRFIEGFTEHRQLNGIARTTLGKNRGLLRSALQRAKKGGIWTGDLYELFEEKFPTAGEPKRIKLTHEQFDKLLREFDELPHHKAQIAFATATGAEERAIHRALRADLTETPIPIRGTKTADRDRHCFRILPWQEKLFTVAKAGMDGDGKFAFKPWLNSVRDLADACSRAGIPRVSLHSLRHVFTAWSRDDGISENVLIKALGHSDGRQLAKTYDDRFPDTIQRRAEEEAFQRQQARKLKLRLIKGGKKDGGAGSAKRGKAHG